jgi:hypothetical protein
MGVPRRFTHSFGVVLTKEGYDVLTAAAAASFLSKAEVARQGLEVWLDDRVSVAAATLSKPRREVLRDALDEYFERHPVAPQASEPIRKGRRRA